MSPSLIIITRSRAGGYLTSHIGMSCQHIGSTPAGAAANLAGLELIVASRSKLTSALAALWLGRDPPTRAIFQPRAINWIQPTVDAELWSVDAILIQLITQGEKKAEIAAMLGWWGMRASVTFYSRLSRCRHFDRVSPSKQAPAWCRLYSCHEE